MTASKFSPRSGLQVLFESACFIFGSKRNRCFNLPRAMFRCVDTFPLIMLNQARVEVASDTGVMSAFVALANENIDIEEAMHLLACQAVVFGAQKEN
jgi:hypothetical protein